MVLVASETLPDELSQLWKAEVFSLLEVTAADHTPFRNVHWLHTNEAIECSQCSMGDGVQRHEMDIEHMLDTEDITGVGMEKEDLGPTMFMF